MQVGFVSPNPPSWYAVRGIAGALPYAKRGRQMRGHRKDSSKCSCGMMIGAVWPVPLLILELVQGVGADPHIQL